MRLRTVVEIYARVLSLPNYLVTRSISYDKRGSTSVWIICIPAGNGHNICPLRAFVKMPLVGTDGEAGRYPDIGPRPIQPRTRYIRGRLEVVNGTTPEGLCKSGEDTARRVGENSCEQAAENPFESRNSER